MVVSDSPPSFEAVTNTQPSADTHTHFPPDQALKAGGKCPKNSLEF